MSLLSTQPYKGTRDFYPQDMRIQKWMFAQMRSVLESYGYEEYDASVVEPYDLFASKTSEEIINEQIYDFKDRGGRRIVLRPEMTPSVSRMVAAKRNELAYPLRWYSIPNVWRYERPQKGRLREHWQLNVDLFGLEDSMSDVEIVEVADALMQKYGATRDQYVIKFNSRKLIQAILTGLEINEESQKAVCRLIDRMHKLETSHFKEQIARLVPNTNHDELMEIIQTKDLDSVKSHVKPEIIERLSLVENSLRSKGITNVQFDMTLMRGFDYYTDFVFEIFDTSPNNNRSMFGGGRYDNLLSLFGSDTVPTIGFGFGDVTLRIFLEENNLIPGLQSETDLYVLLLTEDISANDIIDELRAKGINIAIDYTGRKIDKRIKTAEKKGIKHVLFIGADEIDSKKYTLKNLDSGEQYSLSIHQIVEHFKK